MTPADLRAWQDHMGFTYDTAASALGVNRSTYAALRSGQSRTTGQPKDVDRRTALACAAIAAGLAEWRPNNTKIDHATVTTQGRSTK